MSQILFPVVLYRVCAGEMASVPAASFNIIADPDWAMSAGTTPPYLAEAEAAGFLFISGFDQTAIPVRRTGHFEANVAAVKDDDTLAYYELIAEPHSWGTTVEDGIWAYNLVKSLDPTRSLLVYDWQPETATTYAACYDIFGYDRYPIGYWPIATWRGWVDSAVAAAWPKPMWAFIQAFGDVGGTYPYWVLPTTDELRCMTYSAIIAGAQATMFWAHYCGSVLGFYLPDYHDFWTYLQTFGTELCTLAPILARAKDGSRVGTSNAHVEGREFTANGVHYLIAANTADSGVRVAGHYTGVAQADVTLVSPHVKEGRAELIGNAGAGSAEAGRSIPIHLGAFVDDFDAYAAHVYRLVNTGGRARTFLP